MNAGTRLGLYGLGLVVAFGGAFAIAGAVVPESVVERWMEGTEMNGHQDGRTLPEDGPTSTPHTEGH